MFAIDGGNSRVAFPEFASLLVILKGSLIPHPQRGGRLSDKQKVIYGKADLVLLRHTMQFIGTANMQSLGKRQQFYSLCPNANTLFNCEKALRSQ